jgi:hypothetical protein
MHCSGGFHGRLPPAPYAQDPLREIQPLGPRARHAPWSEPALLGGRGIFRIRVVDAGGGASGLRTRCPDIPAFIEYLRVRALPASRRTGKAWLRPVAQQLDSSGRFVPHGRGPRFDLLFLWLRSDHRRAKRNRVSIATSGFWSARSRLGRVGERGYAQSWQPMTT